MNGLLIAVTCVAAVAKPVLINNTLPRLTSTGDILDGHDGRITKFNGVYWLHTLSYGDCMEPQGYGCNQPKPQPPEGYCGFRYDHNISVFTSPDLSSGSWAFEGYALDWTTRPPGTVFRPDVVYNPNTNKWVLWWNQVAVDGTYLGYIAATSDTPAGPFTNLVTVTGLTANNDTWHGGDFHIFVDDDGSGYVIYSANHWMFIDRLSPDFLSGQAPPSGSTPGVVQLGGLYFVEAPALFKRNGIYYALFDHCCCFCYQGSGVRVWTAPSPLGPWTSQTTVGNAGDLACINNTSTQGTSAVPEYSLQGMTGFPSNPIPTPGQGCLYNGMQQTSNTRSQQSMIAIVDSPTGEPTYLWIGDRWQQAPDGVKGHEPQYWYPLQFDEQGVVQPIPWVDSFVMDVA